MAEQVYREGCFNRVDQSAFASISITREWLHTISHLQHQVLARLGSAGIYLAIEYADRRRSLFKKHIGSVPDVTRRVWRSGPEQYARCKSSNSASKKGRMVRIMKQFHKLYALSLPGHEERRRPLVAAANATNLTLTVLDAVYGNEVPDAEKPPRWTTYKEGELGCLISHRLTWRKCVFSSSPTQKPHDSRDSLHNPQGCKTNYMAPLPE